MGAMELVEKAQLTEKPAMKSGDTVRVHVKVREGDKERIQVFEGVIIGQHRGGTREGRSDAVRQGSPREAVLPARAQGQGRSHEGRGPTEQLGFLSLGSA